MLTEIKRGIVFTVVMMILLGGGYCLLLWGIGQAVFRDRAEGSLIVRADGSIVGSRLIAQKFTRPSTSSRGRRPLITTRPPRAEATTGLPIRII